MESTALRNPEATSPAEVIDFAVVSSVRREVFRDRSKPQPTAWQSAVKCRLEFAHYCPLRKELLTRTIRRVKPQSLQGLCTCTQKEPHTPHPEKLHVTETESPKEGNHVLHEFLLCETNQRQSTTQRGYGEGNEVRASRALLFLVWEVVADPEVLEVWEEPDEIQDLAGRASRTSESEESKGRCEVSKVSLNVRHEVGYYQLVYPKLLEVRKRGKVTQGPSVKFIGSEGIMECAVTELLDERKQAEAVCVSERPRPRGFPVPHVVDREGVVKMGDGCDVP